MHSDKEQNNLATNRISGSIFANNTFTGIRNNLNWYDLLCETLLNVGQEHQSFGKSKRWHLVEVEVLCLADLNSDLLYDALFYDGWMIGALRQSGQVSICSGQVIDDLWCEQTVK